MTREGQEIKDKRKRLGSRNVKLRYCIFGVLYGR
jgi:hypothetical protein